MNDQQHKYTFAETWPIVVTVYAVSAWVLLLAAVAA
jgi:hypothetical protein